MLNQATTDKLITMRLRGMAEALREQQESADAQRLGFKERVGMLIDRQWNWRENRALDRRLRNGRLNGPAWVEDINYRTPCGLDRQMVLSLTQESVWVANIRMCFWWDRPIQRHYASPRHILENTMFLLAIFPVCTQLTATPACSTCSLKPASGRVLSSGYLCRRRLS